MKRVIATISLLACLTGVAAVAAAEESSGTDWRQEYRTGVRQIRDDNRTARQEYRDERREAVDGFREQGLANREIHQKIAEMDREHRAEARTNRGADREAMSRLRQERDAARTAAMDTDDDGRGDRAERRDYRRNSGDNDTVSHGPGNLGARRPERRGEKRGRFEGRWPNGPDGIQQRGPGRYGHGRGRGPELDERPDGGRGEPDATRGHGQGRFGLPQDRGPELNGRPGGGRNDSEREERFHGNHDNGFGAGRGNGGQRGMGNR